MYTAWTENLMCIFTSWKYVRRQPPATASFLAAARKLSQYGMSAIVVATVVATVRSNGTALYEKKKREEFD